MRRRLVRKPTDVDTPLIAVALYCNPSKSVLRAENYAKFAERLQKQNVPLLTVTVTDDAHQPALQGANVLQLYARDQMWHQPAVVNIAQKVLRGRCKALAWLDADIIFHESDWVDRALASLEKLPVTQPWTTVHYAPPYSGSTKSDWPATAIACAASPQELNLHPGYAWAAKMDFLDELGGLFDMAIAGSNDRILVAGLANIQHTSPFHCMSLKLTDAAKAWCAHVKTVTDGKCVIGATEGNITHLYHGNKKDRRYVDRHKLLAQHGFDPVKHLHRQLNGLWSWADDAPLALKQTLRSYFIQRGD